jgi:hypothetical protein
MFMASLQPVAVNIENVNEIFLSVITTNVVNSKAEPFP